MRRPLDPRHHGLKEPQKVLSKKETVQFGDDGDVYAELIFATWDRIVKDHLSQGHRIKDSAKISGDYYGRHIKLSYEYEWDNWLYEGEKAEWDHAIALYEQELAAWRAYEEERKQKLTSGVPKNIDVQIERAEHRLANLKAAKAGQPLPYPQG